MRGLVERWRGGSSIVILHEFRKPPYGGGNQFLLALKAQWQRAGVKVGGHVGRATRAALFNSHHALAPTLAKVDRARVRIVHRVDGPIGIYRGDGDAIDRTIWTLNSTFADATIFQSRYSLDAHRAQGLAFVSPSVIPNAVDPTIFHAPTTADLHRPVRLIATSWSDNPRKGADIHQWLDAHLDRTRFSFTFAGRLGVPLPNSRVVPPLPSVPLAALLREHDIYVAASEHDPCSNALLEALACGLPALYRRSGGHPELVKDAGLGFDRPEEIPSLLDALTGDYDRYRRGLSLAPIEDVARRYLEVMRPDA